jgi:hypothetical protein
MRRYLGWLLFVGVIALVGAPAFAEPGKTEEPQLAPAPVAVQRVAVPGIGLKDEAAMVLVGTALIGLAAAVRRAA